MKRFYCDKCQGEVGEESDLYWVVISPFYRRNETSHWSVDEIQVCDKCMHKVKRHLGLPEYEKD